MKPADDGCNTCTCNESGAWACTEEACTECAEGDVRQDGCNFCRCFLGEWSCSTRSCDTAECVYAEVRLYFAGPNQCGLCTCEAPGTWSCEVGECICELGQRYLAADGCNTCACDSDSGSIVCTEGGCDERCTLPRIDAACTGDPIFAKSESSDLCCQYDCPAAAPAGWSSYPSRAECEGCPPYVADCDGDPANGCETDVRTSVDHCGHCGNACGLQNATAACNASMCTISSCDDDYRNCNGDPSDGCETYIGSLSNCGGCGVVCDLPPNVEGTCFDGSCMSYGCILGFGDCNGGLADGCETNVKTDPSHCGACGYVCLGPDPHCIEGTCGIE